MSAKFEKTETWGWRHAIRGMRNPMNSWAKSDTEFDGDLVKDVGDNDRKLMTALVVAGEPHRKFLRQIFVSVDITAPMYWWSEFDTYGVGVVKNSTSTMHKLASRPIVESDYSFNKPENDAQRKVYEAHINLMNALNELMDQYQQTKIPSDFLMLKQGLETSYIQTRTVTLNYEVLSNMYRYRKNHRLPEWREDFVAWVHSLPQSWLIELSKDEPGEKRKVECECLNWLADCLKHSAEHPENRDAVVELVGKLRTVLGWRLDIGEVVDGKQG